MLVARRPMMVIIIARCFVGEDLGLVGFAAPNAVLLSHAESDVVISHASLVGVYMVNHHRVIC